MAKADNARRSLFQALSNSNKKDEFIKFAIDTITEEIMNPISEKGTIINKNVGLISSPPILKLKFVNWATTSESTGLFGRVATWTFNPDLENGTVFLEGGALIPRFLKCSLQFVVISTDLLRISVKTKIYVQ